MSHPLFCQEDARFSGPRLLKDNPDLTQREIANQLGLGLGSINYYLRALIDKGLVKIQEFRKRKIMMRYAYLLTSYDLSEKIELSESFLKRKMEEYGLLNSEIESLKRDMTNYQAALSQNK